MNRDLERICDALEAEPLFHISLGSKELFHSNFIAWLADRFPMEVASVFSNWTRRDPSATWRKTDRESGRLDLVIYPPGLAPLVIENKVFSVPDERQLDAYSRNLTPSLRGEAVLVLLSLMDPGWKENQYKDWHLMTYRALADGLERKLGAFDQSEPFLADLVRHYCLLVRLLHDLVELLGTPKEEDPFLLESEVIQRLSRGVNDGIQKARASFVARELRRHLHGLDAVIHTGFTHGMSLVEGFVPVLTEDPGNAELGWQLQGPQFRLVLRTKRFPRGDRAKRERYAEQRFADWFDFSPLARITGVSELAPAALRSGVHSFHGFEPDFVYRYTNCGGITAGQLIKAGSEYLRRASSFRPSR